MSFLFRVNGVPRNDFVRYRTLQIRKDGSIESARLEFLDQAGVFGVYDGDTLHITQDGGLEFGGAVVNVRVQTLDKSAHGTRITVVDAQGWRFEAEDLVVSIELPAQSLLQSVAAVFPYMAAKGWTNISAPSGGPALPALSFTRQTVAAIFDELQKLSGWPWRVNGDRWCAFTQPGSLTAPVEFTDQAPSVVLTGLTWSRDRLRYATRVLATTGGSGQVPYTDTQTGNGTWRRFPLSVFPQAEAPPTAVVEGGTSHPIGGGRWSYDALDGVVVATTAVGAGVAVVTTYDVALPATVRVFDPSTRAADGSWAYAAVIDALLTASEQTDLTQALAWATAELQTRQRNPKGVELSTFAQGLYPWQMARVSFPAKDVDGYFLIQSTLLTDVGTRRGTPRIDLTLLEGDAIGRDWTLYFKERKGATGGGGRVATGGGTGGGGTGGGVGLPPGTTFRLAGDNETAYAFPPAAATPPANWRDAPQAVPTQLGGPGMAGGWVLRVPAFLLAAGTLTVALFDAVTGGVLASVSTSKVAPLLSGDFDYRQVAFTAPTDVHDVLLRAQSASGVADAVIGQCTVVKQ